MSEQSTSTSVIYQPISGFPGYRIGNDGSVWSCRQATDNGPWKRLALNPRAGGHLQVRLYRDGRSHTRPVHRLVLEAFVGACPAGMQCRHFPDRDPTNNSVANLSWGTPAANQADRVTHGTDSRGQRNGSAKLTEEDVRAIRSEYARGVPGRGHKSLARKYRVHPSTTRALVCGRTWTHISTAPGG